jgi:hypothetical protein
VAGQARGQLRRLPVRERGEQQVGAGQEVGLGRGEDRAVQAGMAGELRVGGDHGGAGAAVRGQRPYFQVGMAGQQAEQFPARVAAGARDRHSRTHMPLIL